MKERLRILLISDFFPPVAGGLEFHVDALATELTRRGDEVVVATLTRNPLPSVSAVRVVSLPSLAHVLPHERADRPFHPPIAEPIARRALGRLIEEVQPDVIHGHSWLTASLAPGTDIPVVFTAHDYALVCQLRTLLRPDDTICSGPQDHSCRRCGVTTYGAVKSAILAAGTVSGRRRFPADRILAVSAAVSRALEPHVHVPIQVVPNFVADAPGEEPLPDTIQPGGFVLYAGDSGDHKGVPDVLEAWRRNRPAIPLVLATPRPVELPIPEGVVPVTLTRGQVASAWRRAVLGVVPSRWADPCPTVVLESMRAGVPVIGSRVGGIAELVRDGVDGVLVPPRDPDVLAAEIGRLLNDAPRRARMASAAAERAAQFAVQPVTERIREVYLALTAARSIGTSL